LLLLARLALLTALLLLASGSPVDAADPVATPVAVFVGGDPRSDGGGPGLVGSPLLILAAVVAIGLVTALLTASLVRLGRRD
jgi:hypothetical protein